MKHPCRALCAAFFVTAFSVLSVPPVQAQSEIEFESVVEALTRPAPLTRSLSAAPTGPTEEEIRFLTNLPTRGLTIELRQEVAEIAYERELPRIDLDIPFDFNSDALRADVMPDLVTIGRALTNADLAGYRFIVAGHTDGVGSAAYNQELSERRAAAVRTFLIDAFGVDGNRLVAVGFGFEQLLIPDDPEADQNRRVEVINLEVGWN